MGQRIDRAPEHGVRFTLLRVRPQDGSDTGAGDGTAALRYRGEVEIDERVVPIEVTLERDEAARGGLAVTCRAAIDDQALRDELESTAAALVRSAVRSALSRGQRPPRRVRRWRGGKSP